jgi:hypothetical protein
MFDSEPRSPFWPQVSVLMVLNLLLIITYVLKWFNKKDISFFLKFSDTRLPYKSNTPLKRYYSVFFGVVVMSSSLSVWYCFNNDKIFKLNLYHEYWVAFLFFFLSSALHILSYSLISLALKVPEFSEFSSLIDNTFTLIVSVGFFFISLYFLNFQSFKVNKTAGYLLFSFGLFYVELRRMIFLFKKMDYKFLIYFMYLCTGVLLPIYLLVKTIL